MEMSRPKRRRFNATTQNWKIRPAHEGTDQHNFDATKCQIVLIGAPASDGSAYQEYVLTPKGRGVFPVLVALRQWSEEFSCGPDGFTTLLVDRNQGRPVRKLELRASDGRLLGDGDTELRPSPKVRINSSRSK
jgi:hypothetical protein